jgi:NAD+ kinase
MKCVGIIYNPRRQEAVEVSNKFAGLIEAKGIASWVCSAWEPGKVKERLNGTDLLLSIGGDGTILRTVRMCVPSMIPVLGINQGRLGFMAELTEEEAVNRLPDVLNGGGWIEERALLEVSIPSLNVTVTGLNDIFIGRRSSARLVTIECIIDGKPLTTYRADGVIVSTASGSTGYSLAAGGPILHPESREMVLIPVSAHFTFDKPLVLSSRTVFKFNVHTTHEAMASVDGQAEWQLASGSAVMVKQSSSNARFLRFQPRDYFYSSLESKLRRTVI